MALVSINDDYLERIGDAIRIQKDTDRTYKPREMAAAIASIERNELVADSSNYYLIPNYCETLSSYCLARRVDAPNFNLRLTGHSYVKVLPNAWPEGTQGINGCRLTTVENYAFAYQNSLVSIELPASVTEIQPLAFAELPELRTLILHRNAGPEEYSNTDFLNVSIEDKLVWPILNQHYHYHLTLFVPAAVRDAWAEVNGEAYTYAIEDL